MCNDTENLNNSTNFLDEDTEIESENELEIDKEINKSKIIIKKNDKLKNYSKHYCTFDGCNDYFFAKYRLERHIRKHNNDVSLSLNLFVTFL